MRRFLSLGAFLGVLAAVTGVQAQQPVGSFTAVNPRTITFQRLDTGQTASPVNLANMLRTPTQPTPFSLTNVFHNFTMPSWPPRIATSTPVVPPQNNMIQPNQYPKLNPFPTTPSYPLQNNPYIITRPSNLVSQ